MVGVICTVKSACCSGNYSPSGHWFEPDVLFNAELLIYGVNITLKFPAKTQDHKHHYQAIVLRAVNNKNTDHVETKACGRIQVWLCSTESLTNALIVKYFKLQCVHGP